MNIRTLALVIAAFIVGFYTNAILMIRPPEVVLSLISTGKKTQDLAEQKVADINNNDIKVTFNGTEFNPAFISAPIGKRIEITNTSSDTLMQLISDTTILNTERGFGESERFRVVIMEEGTYTVSTKAAPGAKLEIQVSQ